MNRAILIIATALSLCAGAHAQPQKAKVSAQLSFSALQPGQDAVVAVILDVPAGFHAQSRDTPPPNLPFELKVSAPPSIEFGEIRYPPGKSFVSKELGTLSVYAGQTIVFVPLKVKPDAPLGAIKIEGVASVQVCDDHQCYSPDDLAFSIETKLVSAGEAISANAPEIFATFDPTAQVREAPSTSSAGKLFGRELTRDAYFLAFAGAFIVGMLFNVMPCVLPIVPLKIMGFYHAAAQSRARSMMLGTSFSIGIVATFGVLAVVVIVLGKLAWGQLFGNPWFSALIVVILLALALQTFGMWAIVLPDKVYSVEAKQETLGGNFLFGILTAILSTPCTFGMFLGLLVWAAAQPPVIGTMLVMTVGAGMAFPYMMLSAFPEVAKNFPRTGPWSEILKQMMGFLLVATAVYFGQRFLPSAIGDHGFWWVIFGVIAVAGIFLLGRTMQIAPRPRAIIIAAILSLLMVGGALAATLRLTYVPVDWIAFSQKAFDDARASGKPVVIDFTATWCGNCQFIESTVYTNQRTVDFIRGKDVRMIKADLTNRDAAGWPLLRSLHPVGAIPFTAVYLPNQREPIKLVGIYTTDALIDALQSQSSK